MRVDLDVEHAWTGIDRGRLTVWTAGSSAACGFPFATDEMYLVHAVRDDEADASRAARGELWVSACSRTAALDGAAEDLAQLGPGWRPSAPERPRDYTSMARWTGSLVLLLTGFVAGLFLGRRRSRPD